ncbi:MAG TPA: S41 family peptidase [Gemmatimonadaceae bacterium]|nr:S41 family peptidase [Gemmatimonadaceae bacterium]
MERNSLHRLTIDWPAVRAQVNSLAGSAQTIEHAEAAILHALGTLRDGHSSYTYSTGRKISASTVVCSAPATVEPEPIADIGYVRVRSYSGSSSGAGVNFATSLHEAIRAEDAPALAGWIVDLRGNLGGNMWPMLVGIGPILGSGVVGHFVRPGGLATPWAYSNGTALLGNVPVAAVPSPYVALTGTAPVAVLIDNRVASSGEAIAIAFKQRPNTRFFGAATCGLATANAGFRMTNGAALNLTVASIADRTGATYDGQVHPDEIVVDPAMAAARAVSWLRSGSQANSLAAR